MEGLPVETADAANPAHNVIAAIIENRAKEVGLVCLDALNLRLHLHQFIEAGNSYTNALMLLSIYNPNELLIVTSNQHAFASGLNRATRHYKQVGLARSLFDDTKGIRLIETYARPVTGRKDAGQANQWRESHYLAHGAAGAVLHQFCSAGPKVLAGHSLEVVYSGTAKHMAIDSATIEALELVLPVSSKHFRRRNVGTCLYDMLNRTKTSVGARLLRTSLLQPMCDAGTIQARLDCVQELLESDSIHFELKTCLPQMPKAIHRVCSDIVMYEVGHQAHTAKRIAAMVQSIMQLRQMLQAVPVLAKATADGKCEILQAVHQNCSRPEFTDMLTLIGETLDEDAQPSSAPFINKIQQCFAIKSDGDDFLKLARSSVCRITEDIHEMAEKCRTEHDLPNLKFSYNAQTGFVLQMAVDKKSGKDVADVPRSFIALGKRGHSSMSYTTHELNALNTRLKDATNDCMILTLQALEQLMSEVMQHMGLLTKLVDTIALIDMLCAFADVAATERDYVRPRIDPQGPLAIIQGRHPMVERDEEVEYQPNDTYLSESSSLHIVTGPNMAGKSTYLKQVALIVILAQAGCYVPASFASVPLFRQVFGRIGTGDSIETNASSFMVEMKEMAHILASCGHASLVIVDELGRATSTADGTGIAWAMCENLISSGAKTLLATHFPLLKELALVYPTCKAWQLSVNVSEGSMDYKRNLQPCSLADQQQHYGLVLAAMLGMPQPILDHAKAVVAELDVQQQGRADEQQSTDSTVLPRVYSLEHRLGCLVRQALPGAQPSAVQPKILSVLAALQHEAQQLTQLLDRA